MTTDQTTPMKTCPVCGLAQDRDAADCFRCGWDFSPMLGTSGRVESFLRERLDRARTDWQRRGVNPDLVPELKRDPFETPAEFAVRVSERLWYVGEGELRRAEYEIETGRFPLSIQSPRPWAKPWLDAAGTYSLRLPRDQARGLYQRGAMWPVYARLAVKEARVSLAALVLVVADAELPITIASTDKPEVKWTP